MRRYFLLLLFSFSSLAAVQIEIRFPKAEVKQGSTEKVRLRLDSQSMQSLANQKLKGLTLGETIYLSSVKAFSKKTGEDVYEADARAVFIAVPQGAELLDRSLGQEIRVFWNDVRVVATEESQGLILADFTVPKRLDFSRWILGLLLLGVLTLAGFVVFRKRKKKKELRDRRRKLRAELLGAATFEDTVALWKDKTRYHDEFPHIRGAFARFETVLFRYQFKQFQTEQEKGLVLDAYRTFVSEVQGGFNGV